MSGGYPTPEEAKVVAAAEKLMEETMARYDPSHDAFHGELLVVSLVVCVLTSSSRQSNAFDEQLSTSPIHSPPPQKNQIY